MASWTRRCLGVGRPLRGGESGGGRGGVLRELDRVLIRTRTARPCEQPSGTPADFSNHLRPAFLPREVTTNKLTCNVGEAWQVLVQFGNLCLLPSCNRRSRTPLCHLSYWTPITASIPPRLHHPPHGFRAAILHHRTLSPPPPPVISISLSRRPISFFFFQKIISLHPHPRAHPAHHDGYDRDQNRLTRRRVFSQVMFILCRSVLRGLCLVSALVLRYSSIGLFFRCLSCTTCFDASPPNGLAFFPMPPAPAS